MEKKQRHLYQFLKCFAFQDLVFFVEDLFPGGNN